MAVRVAINGFGRIGRLVLRAAMEAGRKDIEFVAINDLGSVEANAHLLKYDTVHGRFPGDVSTGDDWMDLGAGKIKVTAVRNPAELPWKELGIDIALECTGIFASKDKAAAHIDAGAKRVLVSAPCSGADATIVYGVNDDTLTADHTVVSNASCTTNCWRRSPPSCTRPSGSSAASCRRSTPSPATSAQSTRCTAICAVPVPPACR